MTYQEIKGDLFAADGDFLVHGCNAQGVMGSGVAKRVKELYPGTFESYKSFCDSTEELGRLGKIVVTEETHHLSGRKFKLVNAITQRYYGKDGQRYISYGALESCLLYLKPLLVEGSKQRLPGSFKTIQPSKVILPKIGAGLGGGDWTEIRSLILKHLDCDIQVYFLE